MAYDFWAELASPLKTDFRNAFLDYAGEVYERTGLVLSVYVPAAMGGDMPREDYLMRMPREELPDCLFTMSFGECSHPEFRRRILDRGIYGGWEAVAYFPELMVADTVRLGDRPVPLAYEELTKECYRGEIALVGSPAIPDPTVPLYLYRRLGRAALEQFARNIRGFAAPVNTIRHIGKSSNHFASIFIMPALFAFVCGEKPGARVILPREGAAAEPMVLLTRGDTEKSGLIRRFLFSDPVKVLFEKKGFPHGTEPFLPVAADCRRELICPQLTEVYRILRENMSCG